MAQENILRRILLVCALAGVAITSACGSLYKVKPVVELPPMPANAQVTNFGNLSVRVAPLMLDEESQELFEANLPLSGLLPLRVEMIHNGGEAIELKRLRLRLRDGEGKQWKLISVKQAISHVLKANQIYAYNPQSRKTFEKEFRAYELDLKSALAPAERRRHGFIIFQAPKKAPVASPRGLVLSIDGLSQPAEIRIN
ncbi:MAG: hypothetical protein QOD75_2974 [Blastocatellia bacterium]|jgi:hypothetical protein|nr:hypothetical protein [Blastocatellia bacterium]